MDFNMFLGSVLFLCLRLLCLCNAKMTLHEPFGRNISLLGLITPRYVGFGIQNVSSTNTTRMKIFAVDEQSIKSLCKSLENAPERERLRGIYGGNILVLPRSVELGLSLGEGFFGYLEYVCSLHAFLVITKVPRYLANARPADSFGSFGPLTSTCAIFATKEALTQSEIEMLGLENNFTATFAVDENDYLKLFQWVPFKVVYNGVLGAAYLGTGLYSLYLFVLRCIRNTLTLIFGVVLFVNFATMTFLGGIQCIGAHFTDNKLPESVVSFSLSIFFGTSVGTGILIVILYDDLIHNMFSSKRSLFQKRRSGFLWSIGLTIIVLDMLVACLTGFGRSRQLGAVMVILVSVGFLIAQLAVIYAICAKARTVMRMLKKLTAFRSKLELHFRYWLLIMVLSAWLTICGISVLASSGAVSPALYAAFSIALALGKILYVFSQSKLCAPVKERGMQKGTTAAVSSVGYETFADLNKSTKQEWE